MHYKHRVSGQVKAKVGFVAGENYYLEKNIGIKETPKISVSFKTPISGIHYFSLLTLSFSLFLLRFPGYGHSVCLQVVSAQFKFGRHHADGRIVNLVVGNLVARVG